MKKYNLTNADKRRILTNLKITKATDDIRKRMYEQEHKPLTPKEKEDWDNLMPQYKRRLG